MKSSDNFRTRINDSKITPPNPTFYKIFVLSNFNQFNNNTQNIDLYSIPIDWRYKINISKSSQDKFEVYPIDLAIIMNRNNIQEFFRHGYIDHKCYGCEENHKTKDGKVLENKLSDDYLTLKDENGDVPLVTAIKNLQWLKHPFYIKINDLNYYVYKQKLEEIVEFLTEIYQSKTIRGAEFGEVSYYEFYIKDINIALNPSSSMLSTVSMPSLESSSSDEVESSNNILKRMKMEESDIDPSKSLYCIPHKIELSNKENTPNFSNDSSSSCKKIKIEPKKLVSGKFYKIDDSSVEIKLDPMEDNNDTFEVQPIGNLLTEEML